MCVEVGLLIFFEEYSSDLGSRSHPRPVPRCLPMAARSVSWMDCFKLMPLVLAGEMF